MAPSPSLWASSRRDAGGGCWDGGAALPGWSPGWTSPRGPRWGSDRRGHLGPDHRGNPACAWLLPVSRHDGSSALGKRGYRPRVDPDRLAAAHTRRLSVEGAASTGPTSPWISSDRWTHGNRQVQSTPRVVRGTEIAAASRRATRRAGVLMDRLSRPGITDCSADRRTPGWRWTTARISSNQPGARCRRTGIGRVARERHGRRGRWGMPGPVDGPSP
jgi:hypothetical protein